MEKAARVVLFIVLVSTWPVIKGQEGDILEKTDERSQVETRLDRYNNNINEQQQDTQQAMYGNLKPDYGRQAQLTRLLAHMSNDQDDIPALARALSLQNKRLLTPFARLLLLNRLNLQKSKTAPMLRMDFTRSANRPSLSELPELIGLNGEDLLANEGVDVKPLLQR